MASEKKIQQITAFNSGEYSDKLAGRVDIESFGKSARFMSNFMAEPTGGIKKFYGTDFITEIVHPNQILLVPFINSYAPMSLVLMPDKVAVLFGNEYIELSLQIPSVSNIRLLRWQQINDRLIFVHKETQPFSIDFYGLDNNGRPIFVSGMVSFDDVPYFPIGYSGEFSGALVASDISGNNITLSIAGNNNNVSTAFPFPLLNSSTFTRRPQGKYYYEGKYYQDPQADCTAQPSRFELVRVRDDIQTVVASGVVGVVTFAADTYLPAGLKPDPAWPYALSGGDYAIAPMLNLGNYLGTLNKSFTETIYRDNVVSVLKSAGFNRTAVAQNTLVIGSDDLSKIQDGDQFFTRIITYPMYVDGHMVASAETYSTAPVSVVLVGLPDENYEGRRIKIHMNTSNTITPWWQGRVVETNAIAYSNGHYYRAISGGTCGNIQPAHLVGVANDGGVLWEYLHSGSTTASIVSTSKSSMTIRLKEHEYLPILDYNERVFDTFQWSIWGKDGVHPSQIYMHNNRLGFVCNTEKYGAWNALSCSDNYFDMSTEQYGQQLDTSAIVHLIPNNPDNRINWVLSFTELYMGSYSGEFTVGTPNRAVLTPTTLVASRVSVLGGKNVMPLKYKELNLFVGSTGQEIYTIGYDYTRDDYVPKSLGYLSEHLLHQGIIRMEAINNRDQNVYLVHENGNLSILNYVSDQQILGYSRVNLNGTLHDFCYTYAGSVKAAYVAVERRDGYICLEAVSLDEPTYMLSVTEVDSMIAVSTYAAPRFAGKKVYVVNRDDKTWELIDWPTDGIASFRKPLKNFMIGEEMVCELHSQPAFGKKMEGAQQQSIMVALRLLESGTFEYGASNDFGTTFKYKNWGKKDEYGQYHALFTGDASLNIPTGYAKNANEGTGPYANTTGIGINVRATTPEPFNLLSINEVYQ